MRLKYIVFDEAFPVLFTEAMKHDEVRAKYKAPTSAGFFSLEAKAGATPAHAAKLHVHCYGESISLKLKPAEHDAFLIEQFLNS